jgi:UDP-N-acetyl-D-glucosamine dehydrogenase
MKHNHKKQMNITEKIKNNEVVIGIIGLGYVGLPLAVGFAEANIRVFGFEKSQAKADKINSGENYIKDIKDDSLRKVVKNSYLKATTNFSAMKDCDALIICVPTPLDMFKKPDMSYIKSACVSIGKNMKKGVFICLESTTYPTTTESFMLPIIEKESGLKHGTDFWLAYSPERVDPGNETFQTKNTPKVLGAITEEGLKIGKLLYAKAIDNIHTVSSPRVAEMVKILENTYRLVNISLINELALLAGKMDINIWEVIEAAKTKPFGFQAFYPGPGIGGHCIPLDPFYLEHIAKKYDFDLNMIHTAGHINMRMPHYMYIKISTALNRNKKPVNGSKVFFLGAAYKPNIDDERESPALEIMDIVAKKGGIVMYNDPFISKLTTHDGHLLKSVELSVKNLQNADVVVVTTKHSAYDFKTIRKHAKLIVDLQNAYAEKESGIYKL